MWKNEWAFPTRSSCKYHISSSSYIARMSGPASHPKPKCLSNQHSEPTKLVTPCCSLARRQHPLRRIPQKSSHQVVMCLNRNMAGQVRMCLTPGSLETRVAMISIVQYNTSWCNDCYHHKFIPSQQTGGRDRLTNIQPRPPALSYQWYTLLQPSKSLLI